MINEFSVHPKPQNKNAKIICIACLLIALVLVTVSAFLEFYKGVVSFAGVCFVITAIIFYTKYISVEFYYDIIKDSDGVPLFVVRQISGRRQSTLCRVELADIEKIDTQSKTERKAHKTPNGVRRYNYTPTVSPTEVHRITVSNRYERAEIVIEGSREFVDNLRAYVAEAKEIRRSLGSSDDDE